MQVLRQLGIIALFGLCPLLLTAKTEQEPKSKAGIEKAIHAMKQDSVFQNAIVGLMVADEKGREVVSWNPDLPLLTASTMKTITTGLSLLEIGPDYQYSTRIAYSGSISKGILYGNLYIIGGGDPTLGSRDSIAAPIDTVFNHWAKVMKSKGIRQINGQIVADDRFFTHEVMPESWSWGNMGASYGAGPSGLTFYENSFSAMLYPGLKEGDPVAIRRYYPGFPQLHIDNQMKTGTARSRGGASVAGSDLSPILQLSGTLPQRDSISLSGANKFPALGCAWQFDRFLNAQGIATTASVRMYEPATDDALSLTPVTEWQSAPLKDIIYVTNHISNNLYAETLLKTLGRSRTGVGAYDSAYVAVSRMLQELELPRRGFTQADGSGLSRQNYVSARFFCSFYQKLKDSPIFEDYLNSFPVPGSEGTLKNVIVQAPHKERLHAKSGSLANVRCYAGYVETPQGLYTFAIMVNNYSAPTNRVQPKVEQFLQALTEL
jgi:D-alanyl-D-alanine carboxypeptidase, serine-type, PBP4 family